MYTIMWQLGVTSCCKHHMIVQDLLTQRNFMGESSLPSSLPLSLPSSLPPFLPPFLSPSLPSFLSPFPSKDSQLIYFLLPSPSPHLGSHLYCKRWNMATQDFHVTLIPMPRVFTCLWSHDSLAWQDTVNITWSYVHKGYRTTSHSPLNLISVFSSLRDVCRLLS